MTKIIWWDMIGVTHEVECEPHEDPNVTLSSIRAQGGTISEVTHPAMVG